MYPFIQTIMSKMTVLVPAFAGFVVTINCAVMWLVKRRYAQGRLYNVSQIEFDSQMRNYRLINYGTAAGAVAFTAAAYYFQAYYAKF